MDLPGGPHFKDVTHLFTGASEDMGIDELIMANGYTLNEAMSAVEIGDARMDSGAVLPAELEQPIFDPFTPLLPEEVCWILDRAMACEMHWHAGNALAQTVYTCLFMHQLSTINPVALPPGAGVRGFDAERPLKLITFVIRPGIMGTVKCCDLAYRELVKGNVHDCEDWQGEKADISLGEAVLPQEVIAVLEGAESWLGSNEAIALLNREGLLHRIQFRRTLLQLYLLELPRKAASVMPLVSEARRLLELIRNHPIVPPQPDSPAHKAFDPRIARKLHSIMPLRPLVLPGQEETWDAIAGLLDGWELLSHLSACESLLAWDAVSSVRTSLPKWSLSRSPYMRSIAQVTIFSNGTTILSGLPYLWLVEQFFLEITHTPLNHLNLVFELCYYGLATDTFEDFQRSLAKLLMQHVWSAYHNRPRHRRHLMKTNIDWHILYESAMMLTAKISPRDESDVRILRCVPLAILHWRACVIREIVLSGFELDLYTADERTQAYWYLSEVLSIHDDILRELMELVPSGVPAHDYLSAQLAFVLQMRRLTLICTLMLCKSPDLGPVRRWTSFTVRYKWALRKDFELVATPDPFFPDYREYLEYEKLTIAEGRAQSLQRATVLLDSSLQRFDRLVRLAQNDRSLQLCRGDFTDDLLRGLKSTCENLKEGIASGAVSADASRLQWIPSMCPWFPQIATVAPDR